MDVSKLGIHTPAFMQKNIVTANSPNSTRNTRAFHSAFSQKSMEIDEGELKQLDPEKEEERKLRGKIASEYFNLLTGGNFVAESIEGIYQRGLKEFENIDKSSEDDKMKSIRRDVLESSIKITVDNFMMLQQSSSVRISPFIEKDKTVMKEMVSLNGKQINAIYNSARKLTLNFLEYIRNNQGKLNYSDALKYANKDSQEQRNINSLSLNELTDYFKYAKSSGYEQNLSYSDKGYYESFFNTLADSSSSGKVYDVWVQNKLNVYV